MPIIDQQSDEGWFDSHCHLNVVEEQSLRRLQAKRAGIQHYLVPATQPSDWLEVLSIRTENVQVAAGIHPWFVKDVQTDVLALQNFLNDHGKRLSAIGEIGLDFYPAKSTRPAQTVQRACFEAQLDLAEDHQLPVIVHSVKAHAEVLRILRRKPSLRGVIHAFNGSVEQARSFVDAGFMLGVGPMLLRSPKTAKAIASLPIEHLLLETDAPYMRIGKGLSENPLLDILAVAQRLAELKQQDLEFIRLHTTANARRLFAS